MKEILHFATLWNFFIITVCGIFLREIKYFIKRKKNIYGILNSDNSKQDPLGGRCWNCDYNAMINAFCDNIEI